MANNDRRAHHYESTALLQGLIFVLLLAQMFVVLRVAYHSWGITPPAKFTARYYYYGLLRQRVIVRTTTTSCLWCSLYQTVCVGMAIVDT